MSENAPLASVSNVATVRLSMLSMPGLFLSNSVPTRVTSVPGMTVDWERINVALSGTFALIKPPFQYRTEMLIKVRVRSSVTRMIELRLNALMLTLSWRANSDQKPIPVLSRIPPRH